MQEAAHTYSLVIERKEDEPGFRAYFPALPGCSAEGISYEGTVRNAEDALSDYLHGLQDTGEEIPQEEIESPVALSVTVRTHQEFD